MSIFISELAFESETLIYQAKIGVLIASLLYFHVFEGIPTYAELMITIFLLLTAPVTANFIAKAYMHRNLKEEDLPDAQSDYGWAGYNPPPEGGPKGVTRTADTNPAE